MIGRDNVPAELRVQQVIGEEWVHPNEPRLGLAKMAAEVAPALTPGRRTCDSISWSSAATSRVDPLVEALGAAFIAAEHHMVDAAGLQRALLAKAREVVLVLHDVLEERELLDAPASRSRRPASSP